jgi:hypothetical protein
MVNTYITPFIQEYGTRDGLILSELCQKEFDSWKNGLGFCKQDCEKAFPFMTEKQIRSGIKALLKNGCIERIPESTSFDRTEKYRINPQVYKNYMKALIDKNKTQGVRAG